MVITISGKAEHGKDTLANEIKLLLEQNKKYVMILHYADYVKFIAKTYFDWNGLKDETGRTLLQYIGTDLVRAKDKDFWVKQASNLINLFKQDYDYFLIPDTRFPNEIDYYEENNIPYKSVQIKRLGYENTLTEEQRNHASETALDNYNFGFKLSYLDGIKNLKKCAKDFLRSEELI